MKTSTLIIATALSFAAAAGAQADTRSNAYAAAVQAAHSQDPYAEIAGARVTPVTTTNDRASVRADAVAAARTPSQYSVEVSSRVAPVLSSSTDRASVRAEAVAAAHSPDSNLSEVTSSVYKSEIPATLKQAGVGGARQTGL